MPPRLAAAETGATTTKPESSLSAQQLRDDLEAMVATQNNGQGPAVENRVTNPTQAISESPTAPGRFEAKGADIGAGIDALAARGRSAVESGKVKAAEVRDRVKNGAELAAEKKAAAVSMAKEKSSKFLLAAIGTAAAGAEAVASVPERARQRGRKIADSLNRWGARQMEKLSTRATKTKERISAGLGNVAEKVGSKVESVVAKVDTAAQNWEARLQEARREAEVAAEKARKESLIKSYVEARILAAQEKADAEHVAAVKLADDEREAKVKAADGKRAAEIDLASKSAEGEVKDLSADEIEEKMKNLNTNKPEAGVVVESPTGVTPSTPEPAPTAPATPETPVMPAAA